MSSYLNNSNVVNRIYSNFRGADFRGKEINLSRSPDCLNVWKDYKKTESIRTRPCLEKIIDFSEDIYGIYFYDDNMFVHSGDALYRVFNGKKYSIHSGVNRCVSNGFVCDDMLYFMDGTTYIRLGHFGENEAISVDVINNGYVPTTTIARKPMGGGTVYEDVNRLSDYRKNSFLADGVSFTFFLDVNSGIDDDYVPEVTVNGEVEPIENYSVDFVNASITFNNEPPLAPDTEGQDNVVIKFKKAVPQHRETIMKCKLIQVFDNRVFFSGNPERPNMMWHSSLNDPTYVSDLDYYIEGLDRTPIRGMVAGNNALWVFREPSEANTTIFYHTPSLDEDYGKVFPSAHSSISTGCVGKAINFNDDIVFFSERGMEGISSDVTTEQVVAHRSTLVDSKLTSEDGYRDMVLAEWEGYLLIFIGNKVYLADSRAMLENENHYEYEFFYWELEKNVLCAVVNDGILYIGTDDGVYTLTGEKGNIESYWTTALDKFKHPHKLKTTNKRGCVTEAEGDVSVYVKVEDSDYELVGTHKDVKDYFVSRIKRKKFKDLQLKFHSDTWFSLETVTLECFIGGYIKR